MTKTLSEMQRAEKGIIKLTTGLYIPIGIVLPYVFSFYAILALMEDSGYLPQVAVMMDTTMHKAGVHGLSIIPMLLGFGCNVPGAFATRILETRKEKFITATLLNQILKVI
jgi:ferrous iron transport protein B